MLAAIGYGGQKIKRAIWPLLSRADDLCDTALGTLAGLGATADEREELLQIVRDRITAGELTRGVMIAVQELVGPRDIELAIELLKLAASRFTEGQADFPLVVNTVTRAVDRCPANSPAHDQMWVILRQFPKTVQMTSEHASRCSTSATIVDYVNWSVEAEAKGEIAVYIMLARLGDLVKPQQLLGWDKPASTEFEVLLRRLACKDTAMKGQFATTRFHLKSEAWETALTIADIEPDEFLDAAIMDESNPYVVHEIAEIVSSIRVRQVPQRLLDAIVVAEVKDDRSGYLFRQTALIQIAQSSATPRHLKHFSSLV